MKERDIVNDILTGSKASITSYTRAITECSNEQLRSTLQTLRNEAETAQYQLFQIASQKGYYMPAPPANQNDVNQIKTGLSASTVPTNNTFNPTMK